MIEMKERNNEALVLSHPTPLLSLKIEKVDKEWAEGAKCSRKGRENDEKSESEVFLNFFTLI